MTASITIHGLLITSLLIAGCDLKPKDEVIFDEASLKEMVLSSRNDPVKASESLDSILNINNRDSSVFIQTISYLEKPFGDPNSFYRNEDLYKKVLEAKFKSGWYGPAIKEKSRNKLYFLQQNRPGAPANDFVFTTPAGYTKKMYDLSSPFTLLYFFDPECHACKEMRAALLSSAILKKQISEGNLKLVTIYTGVNEKLWLDHLNEYPKDWVHGWDKEGSLMKNRLYDLKAIPSLYLLDKDKKVLIKDGVNVGEVEEIIGN